MGPVRSVRPSAPTEATPLPEDPLTALAAVAALLLVLAGGAKIRRPRATTDALRLARMPDADGLVRALGLGEVVLGVSVVVAGGVVAHAALAVVYVAFAVFAERQRRAGSSCGCFGTEEAPLTVLHVAVDVVAAGVAVAAAVVAAPPVGVGLLEASGLTATAGALALGVATVSMRHLLTSLPALALQTERVLSAGDGILEVPDA
jgi:hypothetical protein